METATALKRTLGFWSIWAIGVGYVISGMYFGWNLGLIEGGSVGFLCSVILVTILYLAFVACYSELSTSTPKSGGILDHASAHGHKQLALLGGFAQGIEFVFAPPAIAMAIGAYLALFFTQIPATAFALGAYLIFTLINIWGVKQSARFEFLVTVLAVVELLIFAAVCLPHFQMAQFLHNPLPEGGFGILKSAPFAIWFFLGIEGLANLAEETLEPEKTLRRGFLASILTLTALAFLVLFAAVGISGWENVVYETAGGAPSDSPLPLAISKITSPSSWLYHLLVSIGLLGLIASFHGIILASGRSLMALARRGIIPRALGLINPTTQTPARALICKFLIGVIAIFLAPTGELITLSVFGALTLYVATFITYLSRPKSAPKKILAITGLILCTVFLIMTGMSHWLTAAVFVGLMGLGLVFVNLKNPKYYQETYEEER